MTNKTDAAGIQTRYSYDAGGNLLSVTPGANPEITFSYDPLGQPTNMTDAAGPARWTYDCHGPAENGDRPLWDRGFQQL